MQIYCVKCRSKTETEDLEDAVMKNGRSAVRGKCGKCGTMKYKLVAKKGGDIVDTLNKIGPKEKHLRTWTGKKYSFAGPGTDLDARLNPDDTPKEWSKPIDEVDQLAYHHDLAYRDNKDLPSRHAADRKMIEGLNQIVNDKKIPFGTRQSAKLVNAIMKSKVRFGLGNASGSGIQVIA